jgi:hypothetical protein
VPLPNESREDAQAAGRPTRSAAVPGGWRYVSQSGDLQLDCQYAMAVGNSPSSLDHFFVATAVAGEGAADVLCLRG